MRVARAEGETSEAVSLTLDVPRELRDRFRFLPGQHLILRAEIGGMDTRRNYSITSGPGEPISVGIKLQKKGRFSTFAQSVKEGDTVEAAEPYGRFKYSGERSLLLVAAGSGITPILSIAKHALSSGAEATLLYGNRTSESVMFKDALSKLKDLHLSKFSLIHVISRQTGGVPLLAGRIDAAKIELLASKRMIAPGECDGAFLCGPGSMIGNVAEALSGAGIDRGRIHFERFSPPGRKAHAEEKAPAKAADPCSAQITAVLDGVKRAFRMEPGDKSVLDAALRQGIELPYSCRGGMCCTCRCRVLEGSSEMALNYSLEPWELAAGYTLACQTRPTGDSLSLDFDSI